VTVHIPTVPPFLLQPPTDFRRIGAVGRPMAVLPEGRRPQGGPRRPSLIAALAAFLRPFAARSVSG
jgi:hypothetical protein